MTTPAPFSPNAFYERLIAMRHANRKAFETLSPATKLALAHYEQSKRQHELAVEQGREAP